MLNHIDEIRSWFQGRYNNLYQAQKDAGRGRTTAADGGHEIVSTCIQSHPDDPALLLAAFRFGLETSTLPFRFRFYQFSEDSSGKYDVIMTLWRPTPETEVLLQKARYDIATYLPGLADMEALTGCEVGWKKKKDRWSLRSYYYGVLVNGTCQLRSQRDPNMIITSKDELKLWKRQLSINDRVYGPDGSLVIGNRDNVPYLFDKISSS